MPSRLAMQREELLLNLLTPEGDAFLLSSLTVAHSVPLCRQTAKGEKEQQKSQQIRSITFHSLLLGHVLSSLQCHYFLLLFSFSRLTGNCCSFWLFPVFLLEWSPNSDCLCPTKSSLVSFPLGQQYSVEASKSKIRKRDKEGSVLCLENLKKWSIEGRVDLS